MGARSGKRSDELIESTDTDFVNVAEDLGEIVHHKNYITTSNIYEPEITINFNNLELLCLDCHNKEHIATFDEQRTD